MTHDLKVETYKSMMNAGGVPASAATPRLWRLLWATGIPVPPPPFLGFLRLAVLTGSFFAVLFTGLIWVLAKWGFGSVSPAELAIVGPIAGVLFGASIAFYYRRLGRKHRLGSWSAFPPSGLRT